MRESIETAGMEASLDKVVAIIKVYNGLDKKDLTVVTGPLS